MQEPHTVADHRHLHSDVNGAPADHLHPARTREPPARRGAP